MSTSFAKNSLNVFGTRLLVIVIGFIASVIVTRFLGPANRGVMEILIIVPFLLINIGNLGIGNANLYFIGQKKKPIEKIVANSFSTSLILGIILLFIAYAIFFNFRNTIFQEISINYAHIVFIIIPFLLLQKYIQYMLLGQEDIKTRNIIILLPIVSNLLLVITLVVLFQFNLIGVLISSLLSNLFACFLCIFYVNKKTKIKLHFDYQLFVSSVKFGIVPFLALLVMNLIFKADIFLVKHYLDNSAVGLYSLAVTVVEKITLMPEAIGLVLFSRVANISKQEANKLTPLVCRFSMILSALTGIFLFVTAKFLVPFVYGSKFNLSVEPLLILIPGIIFLTLFIILHGDLTGRGKAKITLYIFSTALIINIGLNLVLIPIYGINGAALASTVSYSIGALCLAIAFTKINNVSFLSMFIPTKNDFSTYLMPIAFKLKNK